MGRQHGNLHSKSISYNRVLDENCRALEALENPET